MVLIARKHLIALFVFMLAAHLGAGIYGLMLTGVQGVPSANDIRYHGQTIIFTVVVSAILTSMAFIYIFRKSRDVIGELDRLIELNRFKSVSSADSLKRMGRLGERISTVYSQINDQNERKGLKISALSGIIEFFLRNVPFALVVLDVTGTVVEVSSNLLKISGFRQEEVEKISFSRFAGDVDFREVLSELQNTHSSAERDSRNAHLLFTPVFNRNNEIANVICTFGREDIQKGPIFVSVTGRPETKMQKGFIRGFFGPGDRKR